MKYVYLLVFCLAIFVRLYHITSVPPSPYWDEVSLGYDAFSILKTGKDLHGHAFPIVAFESYGDWKPSGYYYTLVPFIALFGLNDTALRLPSLLAGLAIVIGVGFLAKKIKINPLIAVFVASISPWAIQFSRAGWEVNLATACIVWAVILAFKATEEHKISLPLQLGSIFFFIFSMYTYHVARVISPILAIVMYGFQVYSLTDFYKKFSLSKVTSVIKNNIVPYICMLFFGLLLLAPLLGSLGDTQTTQRFQETSIFNNLDIITESNTKKLAEGNSVISRILYHRYILFGREILKNYFSHFTLDFLFLSGDKNPRHSVQFFGQLYHVELFFLLVGVYAWFRKKTFIKMFFLFWLSIAIIPAAITYASPHALRTLPALPVFLLLIATGISEIIIFAQRKLPFTRVKATALILIVIGGVYFAEFLPFWTFYQNVYPVKYGGEWQYGYKDLMLSISNLHLQYPTTSIFITREKGRPAMYYWYYNQIDPQLVQAQEVTALKDQGEFLEFDTIFFVNEPKEITGDKVLVAGSKEFFAKLEQDYTIELLKSIENLDGTSNWQIGWASKK